MYKTFVRAKNTLVRRKRNEVRLFSHLTSEDNRHKSPSLRPTLGQAYIRSVEKETTRVLLKAPYFSLPVITSDGLLTQGVDIFSLRGKVVVLEFMVSSCEVCQRMAPAVESLYQEYRGMGVTFLSVAGTFGGASAESTAQFIREYGASWTHVFDQDNSVFQKYGIEGTPTYFVIDRTGIILSRFEGMTPTAAFKAAIDIALSG